MNECSEKCKSCVYSVNLYMPTTERVACQYIIIEKKERNCECGEKCTKYKEGKRKNCHKCVIGSNYIHRITLLYGIQIRISFRYSGYPKRDS